MQSQNLSLFRLLALGAVTILLGCHCREHHCCDGSSSTATADRIVLEAEGALGPYSGSVLSGSLVFVSGKIGKIAGQEQTYAEEVETCLDRIEAELARSGLDFSDVVDSLVFLTDMERYGEFNALYGARLPAPYPTRACIGVAALPADARVEIKVTARRR